MLYDVKTALPKPKWYEIRKLFSNLFLWFAKKLYPESPEVYAFMVKQATDMIIYGEAIMHVDYAKMVAELPNQE